ncbi:preprotein translocase subunit YajC [Geothermobacter hydrogeniphilus]|uniref:Sec translocon accessory complex subunit YajC n=1 Tax=Geothermobacter hydrogeniphilus TaxID=1969733 RepID=A0A1X0Y914_9BACT|nr:preprotein translocase subunit YajC [Geothermobacter hydrogeniphilus]ORJ61514.1 preprotein translocase subunit YajC [Geothermobacter hydrogeniphilus]PNU20754.1 preprotein translocase subunit YajC [Geothermobacter hydrogeniphilus]
MFASTAYAMATNGGGAAGQQNPYSGIIMLVIMFAIFYFLLIRPQQKRAKQHKQLVESLKVGDQVTTAGGMHGRIAGLQDDIVTVEIATGVKVKFNRSSIVAAPGQNPGN